MTIWTPRLSGIGRPISLGLADAIEEDLAAGVLTPGQRLPTHRDLAEALGVSVGAVTRGYAEAARRGLVRGVVGRGTVVAPAGEEPRGLPVHEAQGPDTVDLGLVTPLYGLDPDLGQALRGLAAQPGLQDLLRYQPSRGMLRHREAGARWAAHFGLGCGPDEILVCAGSQHAIMVAFSTLFRPGDRILTDPLTYPGFIGLAVQLGLRLVPVEADGHGILPEAAEEACVREPARGLYLMPGFHNPTTARLPDERREDLADLARRRNLLVVEDDSYGLTVEDAGPPLASLVPERGFLAAGLSKAVAGGLRVAFLRAPSEHVRGLAQGVTVSTWMAAPLCAEIACRWIADGTALAALARKREEARARNRLALDILAGQRVRSRETGYFVWLELPEPWSSVRFEQEARERGVVVVGADRFAVGTAAPPRAVRIALSAAPDQAVLARGLDVLAAMLREGPGFRPPVF